MAEEIIIVNIKDTIPLKKAVAKKLYLKNFDQSKISQLLNITQPMVSNYLSTNEKISDVILEYSNIITNKILKGDYLTFNTSITFSEKYKEGSFYLANKNEIINDENKKIIDNLSEAFLLLKGKDIKGLVPEIKINIAMAKDKAKNPEEIASFLNGLIILDDKITSNNGIRFGTSKHLSKLLLDLKYLKDVKAIMNIAYIKNLKKSNFSYSYLTKDYQLENKTKKVDVLLHKGDFGIEPCSYIVGRDAVDVSKKLLKIIDGLEDEK